ncbi:hypothetical protein B005_4614 [Nocardiopsis alba ATCC BAA-2165]|uniref:Uncharacterized protein n=1 Tax=Nocardiopsis alba (strain ATCC BAA-2165 / BE74) TaxID=1205910 RepID=J7L7T3_NOCAA|nr:hypothetical protein B005_4614 [Nocardiopsis alba ATCC BAA-2165]
MIPAVSPPGDGRDRAAVAGARPGPSSASLAAYGRSRESAPRRARRG